MASYVKKVKLLFHPFSEWTGFGRN